MLYFINYYKSRKKKRGINRCGLCLVLGANGYLITPPPSVSSLRVLTTRVSDQGFFAIFGKHLCTCNIFTYCFASASFHANIVAKG